MKQELKMKREPEVSSMGAARQKFWFQFVTTPTADTPGTVLVLHFDNQRYLFGRVAEGTQRACIQRGLGLRKVQNIFLTGDSAWSANGGLLGMLLTVADVHASAEASSDVPQTRSRLNIHGGPRLAHTFASARRFIFRTGMPLTVHEYGLEDKEDLGPPTWTDENIGVWALPLKNIIQSSAAKDDMSHQSVDKGSRREVTQTSDDKQDVERLVREQNLRYQIVQDMFDSDWRMDKLIELPFKEVKLPARVWLRDPHTKALSAYQCASMTDAPEIAPDTKVQVRQPWPASRNADLPSSLTLPERAISYIIRGHSQRGAFDKNKAVALGLKPGPRYSELVAGKSVELEGGQVITPEMVLGPTKPGKGIAIVDLPDPGFISDFLNRPEWTNKEVMDGVECFCWLLGDEVVNDARLQDFMRSMTGVKHIVSSADTCPNYLAMDSSAASSIRLSRISKEHFPIPIHDNLAIPQLSWRTIAQHGSSRNLVISSQIPSLLQYRPAERGLKIQVEPEYRLHENEVARPLNTAQVILSLPKKAYQLAQIAQEPLRDPVAQAFGANSSPDPEIVTLGTGSAVPSKYRNVSATLLRIPEYGNYLFDCGENTLGQLKRMYNPEELFDILTNLRFIWISHLHADHHLGTLSLLNAASEIKAKTGGKQPLYLVAEPAMMGFVTDISPDRRPEVVLLACEPRRLTKMDSDRRVGLNNGIRGVTGLHIQKLETCFVSHCNGAQAISVTFDNGFKFSYSGDCRPSHNFTVIGADSDVLVHEATFDDGLEGDAKAKKHCTTGEALGVAAKMRAKNVILTHFSQRYQKIPVMNNVKRPEDIAFEEGAVLDEAISTEFLDGASSNRSADADIAFSDPAAKEMETPQTQADTFKNQPQSRQSTPQQMNVCVAFDYMRTKVSQIKDMHKLYPAIEALFEAQNAADTVPEEQKNEAANRIKVKRKLQENADSGGKKQLSPSQKRAASGNGKDMDMMDSLESNLVKASSPSQAEPPPIA